MNLWAENDIINGNKYTKQVEEYCKNNNYISTIISAQVEAEIAVLDSEEEKQELQTAMFNKEKGNTLSTSYLNNIPSSNL